MHLFYSYAELRKICKDLTEFEDTVLVQITNGTNWLLIEQMLCWQDKHYCEAVTNSNSTCPLNNIVLPVSIAKKNGLRAGSCHL